MGYVLPDKPDIFLSYAPDEDEVGWVSEFAQWLRIGLGRAIGRNDACELWTDLKLAANARRSAAVEEKIGDCAVMIIVHSNFYLESAWCRTEMSQFLEQELTRRTGTGSPVFVVETLNVERPPALKKLDLLGKRFWYMDPLTNRVHTMGFSKAERGDSRYINQIIELSEDIAAELKRQKEENSRARANTGARRSSRRSWGRFRTRLATEGIPNCRGALGARDRRFTSQKFPTTSKTSATR